MPWNNGGAPGPGPWGNPGGTPGDRPGGSSDNGSGNGGNRGQRPGGPWGGGPGGPAPDLDDLIARAQKAIRNILPPGFGGPRGPRRPGGPALGGGRAAILIVLVALAAWLASGFYRVQPDEQGVVLRFGAYNRTTLPGLNYHVPWPVESVLLPSVTHVNRVEVGYRTGNPAARNPGAREPVRDIPQESLMLTGDENIIDINFAVFWRVRSAQDYLFNTRNPDNTVKQASESVMREVIGRTPIQPALTDARAAIEQSVQTGVQAILNQYGSGVEITQVQLQKVDPPAAVIDSFRDVQRAVTDAERMRNEAEGYHNDIVPRARGDAARLVAEADAARQASLAEATGQAKRFLSVLHAYEAAKDVTLQRMYIETMQDILTHTPTVVVDNKLQNIVPFLPLNNLGQTPPKPAAPAPVVNPPTAAPQGASQ
jgi:modulator of FtsH protease HflK